LFNFSAPQPGPKQKIRCGKSFLSALSYPLQVA